MKYRDNELRRRLLTEAHAPAEYRVNQVLKNSPAFHAAVAIKPGHGMYLPPEEQVRLW